MLFIENLDRPGVIGDVGKFLALKNVNISSFNLSRNKKGGKAMAVVSVDSTLNSEDLKGLKELPNVDNARALLL
jgi:D-3-phosphoglycerate dehydrogenase